LYGTRYPTVIYWGLRDLKYPRFVVFTLAGMLPWTLMLAAIGFQLSGHIDQFDDWLKEAKNLIFSGVVSIVAVVYLRHRFKKKIAAPEAALPENGPGLREVAPAPPASSPDANPSVSQVGSSVKGASR
jgi:hypothetical protein